VITDKARGRRCSGGREGRRRRGVEGALKEGLFREC
jgi:hypothetical protein